MSDTNKIIDCINQRIEKKEITKTALAEKVGVNRNSLSKYLSKTTSMPFNTGICIAKYLHIDISKLYDLQNEDALNRIETEILVDLRQIEEPIRTMVSLKVLDDLKLFKKVAKGSEK